MLRAIELSVITEKTKNKIYDDFYENQLIKSAKSLAEKGLNECEFFMGYERENVEIYYSRLIQLLKMDEFTIVESIKPSLETRQDLYIKFSW